MPSRRAEPAEIRFSLWGNAFLGLVFSLVTLVCLVVVAALVTSFFIEVPGDATRSLALGLQYAAVLIGGAIAGRRAGQRGIAVGGAIGVVFSVLQLVLAARGGNIAHILSAESLARVVGSIVCAVVGGVLGVNL
ncbi:MAG TPA: TIGR04086 family membrane protein [Firmicutes bacterium]|nr:TIGR04086 family membrane protein [Bacillota bacterium]